jgi:hypothetical protein
MKKPSKRPRAVPNTGSEPIPPGATAQAADRPLNPGGGAPGSGGGSRHAADDPGSPNESYEGTDSNQPLAEEAVHDESESPQEGPPYAGISGGAVGGSPAEGRSAGGGLEAGQGITPEGVHRGDSTIGSITSSAKEPKASPRKKKRK